MLADRQACDYIYTKSELTMKTTWFSLLLLCSWLSASATFKTVIGNAGTGWNVSSNWSPAGVPVSGDSVFIPTGQIITVKGAIYAVDALIHMVVRGTLDFEPSGKLDLLGESTLQIVTGGMITSDNNNSEVIKIGGITKFQGAVDPSPLNGPVYASQATGTSPSGFVTGTLATNIKNYFLSQVMHRWSRNRTQRRVPQPFSPPPSFPACCAPLHTIVCWFPQLRSMK